MFICFIVILTQNLSILSVPSKKVHDGIFVLFCRIIVRYRDFLLFQTEFTFQLQLNYKIWATSIFNVPTMQLLLMAINIADNIACIVHASSPLVPIDPLPNHKASLEANRMDSFHFCVLWSVSSIKGIRYKH